MSNTLWIITAVVAILIIGFIIGLVAYNRRRAKRLKGQFGPEYDRTIEEMGSKKKAQKELEERAKHLKSLQIHPLTVAEHDRYKADWIEVQAGFVDDPDKAVAGGARLIMEVMQLEGYPVSDFEHRAADLSVQYPELVGDDRAAQAVAVKSEHHEANTEELRQALLKYRSVFNELLVIEPNVEPASQVPAK